MATTTTTPTSDTTPALIRFTIHATNLPPTNLTHTHPIPLFLCHATPDQQASPAYTSAFVDVLSMITAHHHTECMRLLTTDRSSCVNCSGPATDCLKSPRSFLTLSCPLVAISIYPTCGSPACSSAARAQLLAHQRAELARAQREQEEGWGIRFGEVACAVCGKGDARRCGGCGKVGYCGKACQVEGWKGHRRECGRGYKPKKEEAAGEESPWV